MARLIAHQNDILTNWELLFGVEMEIDLDTNQQASRRHRQLKLQIGHCKNVTQLNTCATTQINEDIDRRWNQVDLSNHSNTSQVEHNVTLAKFCSIVCIMDF